MALEERPAPLPRPPVCLLLHTGFLAWPGFAPHALVTLGLQRVVAAVCHGGVAARGQ